MAVVERDLAAVVERARETVKVVTVVATAEGVKEGVEAEAVRAAARAAAAKVEAREVALRRHIALLACVAHRAKQVCQVSSLWVTYSER